MQTDPASKFKGLVWVLFGALFAASFALGLPWLSQQFPWSLEKKLALALGEVPDLPICHPPISQNDAKSLQEILHRLYPLLAEDRKFPVTVSVLRGKTVNAFATLGGRIYIYNALIQEAESADELAGVLAHEIEHVRHRHILQGVFSRVISSELVHLFFPVGQMDQVLADLFLNMRFTLIQEEEADRGALERLKLARISTLGVQHFFVRLARSSSVPAILSDHPDSEHRAELFQKGVLENSKPVLDQASFQRLKLIYRTSCGL